MTVSPAIRAALEVARDALTEIVAEAPAARPVHLGPMASVEYAESWGFDEASFERAETARPALEKINAALAEMEAQS